MTNPWEAFCKRLDSSPTHTVLSPQCFNSVKIDGLNSVKRTFIPDERLLTCRNCGVIFVRDKAQSHYDAFPNCREKSAIRADILPYHAVEMYQKLCDEIQTQEKRTLKRSKTDVVRRGKVIRNSSHAQFENNSAAIASDHSRKRVNLKSKILSHPALVEASLERDKMSSSSSYDRLSCGEVNSPGSGTESSSSAPSKLVENPPSMSAERNLFENLERDFASSAPKSRRVCDYNSSVLPSNQLNRSINSLLNDHPQSISPQSYPSSPASPHVDRKEATYVPPNVHSSRKQVSIKTARNDHAEMSPVRAAKQQTLSDPQMHCRMQSQFDSLVSTPFKHQQKRLSHQITPVPDSIDLVSDGPDSDYEIPNFYIPTEKSLLSTYHDDETSQFSIGRQQASRSNAIFRNGSKNSFPDYIHLTKIDSSWDPSSLSSSSDSWSRNSSTGGGNYYDNFEPMQVEKRANYSMYNQRLRNPPEQSQDLMLRRSQRPSDSGINLLEQCGCVEMGDVRCKNSIYCQVHTWEEKKRVQRSCDKSEILKDLRCQQKLSRMMPDVPRINKIRRMSPSTTAAANHPSTSSTAVTSIASASLMTVTATSSSRGANTGLSFPQQLSAVSNAATQSTRHVPVNGNVVESGSARQQPQQPTVVHRRVHNLSNLLRRSNQVWGQEKPASSFPPPSSQVASLPPPTGFPPGCSSFVKVPRKTSHIEIGGGVPEIQSRVVVNDEHEKSITGRSRKASRNTAMRQASSSSSLQNTYFQHYTATPNRGNPTALIFRTSPASSHFSAKIRGAAASAGREPGSVGLANTANSSVSWMGYNRPFNISDLHLSVSTTAGSAPTTLPRHSSSSNPSASAAMVNQHPGGSSRYIVIGSNAVGRTGSVSRLTSIANKDLFQQQQRQHSTSSTPSSGLPPSLGFPSSTIENPREIVIDLAEESERNGSSVDFLFNGGVAAAANADASAEAAAAVANLEALGAGSSFCVNPEPEDVDLYLNHNPQQQQQHSQQFPRNQTGNGRPSPWGVPPSGVGSASSSSI